MKQSRYQAFLAVWQRTLQELAEGKLSMDGAKLRVLAEIAGAVCTIADEVTNGRGKSGTDGRGSNTKGTSGSGK